MGDVTQTSGPDLKSGVAEGDLADDTTLVGHVDGDAVLLARRGPEVFAIGATCTHYGGPLGEDLIVDDTVRDCSGRGGVVSARSTEVMQLKLPPLQRQ